MTIERELTHRSRHRGAESAQHGEHRPRDLRRPLEVQDAKGGADFPMGDALILRVARRVRGVYAQNNIVVGARSVGRQIARQIGYAQQQIAHPLGHLCGLGREGAFTVTDHAALVHERVDRFVFARPPQAKPLPCDLHQVLERTLDLLELQLGDAQVTVKREFMEELPLVYADPDLMQQVLLNLCLNAVQAMPEGGELTIGTGVRRYRTRRSLVDISVRDTGVGIPKDLMAKIFDPFFTTRSMGTGLGLPISVQIVRDTGGVITAKNNSGGGATLRVSLPLPAEPPGRPEE